MIRSLLKDNPERICHMSWVQEIPKGVFILASDMLLKVPKSDQACDRTEDEEKKT